MAHQHIVSFSTGLSSAITVERVIARYGVENTHIVFMDTKIEDEDNYRFMNEVKKRWPKITVLAEGRTPYEVAKDAQIIPNNRIAPCTFKLKIELFRKWVERFRGDVTKQYPNATIHIGYDFTEVHRCKATSNAYNRLGWMVDYPLLWKPYEFRDYSVVSRDDWGIEPPRMYVMGYSHANCGGRCVKQGQGDWLRTLINFPERYAEAENWENTMRNHPVRKDYAIMKEVKGGVAYPLTLSQLRRRYEADKEIQPSLLDLDAPCVVCGIGDML